MKRILVATACCLLFAGSACGGSSSSTKTPTTPKPGGTTAAGATPNVASGTTAAATGSTPGATKGADGSPANGTAAPARTLAAADSTAISGGIDSVSGGDASLPRQVVSTIPAPPPGKTPIIDPTSIAEPEPPAPGSGGGGIDPNALQLVIDLDASTPGIQATRDVAAGDVFRVAVVILNVPAGPGLDAFNFEVDYPHDTIVAPSFAGGESIDRNPDFNQAGLGSGWSCLPAPQGDLDDEGGLNGDSDPSIGQAFLSCFALQSAKTGNIVIATIEFHAAQAGTASLILSNVNAAHGGQEFARCPGATEFVVPCSGATVTVK